MKNVEQKDLMFLNDHEVESELIKFLWNFYNGNSQEDLDIKGENQYYKFEVFSLDSRKELYWKIIVNGKAFGWVDNYDKPQAMLKTINYFVDRFDKSLIETIGHNNCW